MLETLAWIVVTLLGLAAITTAVLWRALDSVAARLGVDTRPLPAMVAIRPVRGLEPGLAGNVRAALAQAYPGPLETIFVLDGREDPAYAVVRRLVDASGVHARLVIAGPRPAGRTGKLHAMITGLRAARLQAPLVCFADSDTRPAPSLLADLARAVLAQPDVGAAFAPAVSVSRPRTAGDVGYGLLLDGLYGPQAALEMSRAHALPFIMGQTMVLRRAALKAAGGLVASEGQLVDDMDIGARVTRAGFRNVLIGRRLPIRSQGMAWSAFWSLALRWMIYSRTGIPLWPFSAPALAFELAFHVMVLVAVLAALLRAPTAAAMFTLAALMVPVALQVLRRKQGAAPLPLRLGWALPLVLWLTPLLFVEALFARVVEWRGRSYTLDAHGRLAPAAEDEAAPPAPRRQAETRRR